MKIFIIQRLDKKVLGVGLEPTRTQCPQDFLTTIVFTTISVCGLDYTFTISYDLGAPCLVSTPSSFLKLGSGFPLLEGSPNLRSSTFLISQDALKFSKS